MNPSEIFDEVKGEAKIYFRPCYWKTSVDELCEIAKIKHAKHKNFSICNGRYHFSIKTNRLSQLMIATREKIRNQTKRGPYLLYNKEFSTNKPIPNIRRMARRREPTIFRFRERL